MIVKREDGYYVVSEKTEKNLGGPYKTREEAEKRLRQVEFFKHQKAKLIHFSTLTIPFGLLTCRNTIHTRTGRVLRSIFLSLMEHYSLLK